MGNDPVSKSFQKNIRLYNNALAMTSVGRQLDRSVNEGRGPYVFKLHGELIHRVGSLLPPEGDAPIFAQLYIYDTDVAWNHRMGNVWNNSLDLNVLHSL